MKGTYVGLWSPALPTVEGALTVLGHSLPTHLSPPGADLFGSGGGRRMQGK